MVATLDVPKVDFQKGDMDGNFQRLLEWLKALAEGSSDTQTSEELVLRHIASYQVVNAKYGELDVPVGPGKFKSALLLYYLSRRKGTKVFRLYTNDYADIRAYFPEGLIQDALNDVHTKHLTVRALLHSGCVTVTIAS